MSHIVMYHSILSLTARALKKRVPATGLGIFRIFFSLVILQEIFYLIYFRHLIFDPVPFIDMASPLVPFFLILWAVAVFHLMIGRYTRFAAIANYLFWVVFTVFTPMWQDFDGGFDQLMIGSSFLLMFLPTARAFSIDNLRFKLNLSNISYRYDPPQRVSAFSYYILLAISLGLLYFDSAVHKLFAEFWRNGMGAWLPSSMPYYVSGIDLTWLLNNKPLQMFIGYAIIVFEFVFVFLCYSSRYRVPLMAIGVAFHVGIVLSLNIYPFGFGMLVHYILMVPFAWWRHLRKALQLKQPVLTVFYDQQCPLCNRTVIIVEHFDFLKAVEFKSLQSHAGRYRELDKLSNDRLLRDLYSLDRKGRLYVGLDTYIQIFMKMKYTALLGFCMKIPGIYHLGKGMYRHVADERGRLVCDENCPIPPKRPNDPFARSYERYGGTPQQLAIRVSKLLVLILFVQLNSTIHYGILDRLGFGPNATGLWGILGVFSDSITAFSRTFLGITPRGLYMDDHFEGYDHIFAFTYRDQSDQERWLPFVNEEGRIIAPNWGRVQSMWANIAVTGHIEKRRLNKFTKKVTAFWGTKLGLDLADTEFIIKIKQIYVPTHWEKDLRNRNLSQPWQNIGKVIWKDEAMGMDLDINIEAL